MKKERDGKGKRARFNSLKEAEICSDRGIEVETFDTTIEKMNSIQEELLLGNHA